MKQCDITKIEPLLALLKALPASRGEEWTKQFYSTVTDASFRCGNPQIFTGPDGFPYFSLLSPEPLKAFDSFCLCNLAEPATERGFGVALNRRSDGADWVFSYGDMLALRLTGTLMPQPQIEAEPPQKIALGKGEVALFGAPSESYLPKYARNIIRSFMQQSLGIKEPKVFLMHRAADKRPMQIVFSVFREKHKIDQHYFNTLNHLSWFLPRHYSITGIPMFSELCSHFVPV